MWIGLGDTLSMLKGELLSVFFYNQRCSIVKPTHKNRESAKKIIEARNRATVTHFAISCALLLNEGDCITYTFVTPEAPLRSSIEHAKRRASTKYKHKKKKNYYKLGLLKSTKI